MSDITELAEALRLPFYISDGKVIGPDSKLYSAEPCPSKRGRLCLTLNKAYGIGHDAGYDKGRAEGIEAAAKAAKETA